MMFENRYKFPLLLTKISLRVIRTFNYAWILIFKYLKFKRLLYKKTKKLNLSFARKKKKRKSQSHAIFFFFLFTLFSFVLSKFFVVYLSNIGLYSLFFFIFFQRGVSYNRLFRCRCSLNCQFKELTCVHLSRTNNEGKY